YCRHRPESSRSTTVVPAVGERIPAPSRVASAVRITSATKERPPLVSYAAQLLGQFPKSRCDDRIQCPPTRLHRTGTTVRLREADGAVVATADHTRLGCGVHQRSCAFRGGLAEQTHRRMVTEQFEAVPRSAPVLLLPACCNRRLGDAGMCRKADELAAGNLRTAL